MKTIITAITAAVLLSSCAPRPDWEGAPNPLDTPATHRRAPESMGTFGPHSEYFR